MRNKNSNLEEMYLTPKEERTVQIQHVVEKLKTHTHTHQTKMNLFFSPENDKNAHTIIA